MRILYHEALTQHEFTQPSRLSSLKRSAQFLDSDSITSASAFVIRTSVTGSVFRYGGIPSPALALRNLVPKRPGTGSPCLSLSSYVPEGGIRPAFIPGLWSVGPDKAWAHLDSVSGAL